MNIKLFTNTIKQLRDSKLNRIQKVFFVFLEVSNNRRYREWNLGRSNTGHVFYR